MSTNDTTDSASRSERSSRDDYSQDVGVSERTRDRVAEAMSASGLDQKAQGASAPADAAQTASDFAAGQARLEAESRAASQAFHARGGLQGAVGRPDAVSHAGSPAPDQSADRFEPTPPPDTAAQRAAELGASAMGRALGTAQAAAGWAGDMVGGVAAMVETGFEAGVTFVEQTTGIIPDSFAARQEADLRARADDFMAAAKEAISDPVRMAEALAENFAARFDAADTLEAAYRSGHADLSVYQEAERIRGEAAAELAALGIEAAAIGLGGAGLIAKALRGAKIADRLGDADPVAAIMKTAERDTDQARAVAELVAEERRRKPFNAGDVYRRLAAGRAFDQANAHRYDVNQVYIDSGVGKSGQTILDSYNTTEPRIVDGQTVAGSVDEIVSRKNSQLADIRPETAIGHLRELEKKYAPGMPIADTPTTRAAGIENRELSGAQILEVPVQQRPVPQEVLDWAASRPDPITIRDVEGRVYR